MLMSTSRGRSPSRRLGNRMKLWGRKYTCIPRIRIWGWGIYEWSRTPTHPCLKCCCQSLIFNLPNTVSSLMDISKHMPRPQIRAPSEITMRIEWLLFWISQSPKTALNGRRSPTLEFLMDMEAPIALITWGIICIFLYQNRKGIIWDYFSFPSNMKEALLQGFEKCEKQFNELSFTGKLDRSGSCAIVAFFHGN